MHVLAGGIFGKQAPDFTNHIYFRYPDKPTIYLAHGMVRGELGESDLDYELAQSGDPKYWAKIR